MITTTSEEHCPSLSVKHLKKTVPIPTSVQCAKNTNIMVMSEECDMWCLVYCQVKLFLEQRNVLPSVTTGTFLLQLWSSSLKFSITFPFFCS